MNNSNFDPNKIAWNLIQAALKAVDPAVAVKNFFAEHPETLTEIQSTLGRIIVVGAGKACTPMALAITELLGDQITAGQVIVKYDHVDQDSQAQTNIKISEGGHPLPDEAGFAATANIIDLLQDTTAEDTVICLISGGGSALLNQPVTGISLADLQQTTQALLAAGATIDEFNTIRKHLSKVKGGGIARLAAPAALYALILSDVVADPLSIIASGPTVPDPSTFDDAWAIIERYRLESNLPETVVQHLRVGKRRDIPDTPKSGDAIFERVQNVIIGSNRIAAQAAVQQAKANGVNGQLLSTFIEGEAREIGKAVAGLAKGLIRDEGDLKRPACFVLGGETTVTLTGEGKGGRNQEMALAVAIALEGWVNTLVVCLATDGTDGPTDAAGAFADGDTVARARQLGLDPQVYLERNDAYNFFSALDQLIMTGPTQTNVNDLIFILAW